MKGKTSNNNPINGKLAKNSTSRQTKNVVIGEYFDCNIMRKKPVMESSLIKLAEDMKNYYLQNENVYTIKSFLIKMGISKSVFYEWAEKCAPLKEAHVFVKMILSDRLTSGSIERRFDSASVNRVLPLFDEEAWNLEKERALLKKDSEEKASTNYTIVIDRVASSDIVPELKKPKDEKP